MISIQFIIPYPELEATVRSLCEVYRSEERLTYRISVASRFQEPAEVPPVTQLLPVDLWRRLYRAVRHQ